VGKWVGDHVLHNTVVMPGAGLLEHMFAAILEMCSETPPETLQIDGFSILRPMVLGAVQLASGVVTARGTGSERSWRCRSKAWCSRVEV
jgi:hypothetical protein